MKKLGGRHPDRAGSGALSLSRPGVWAGRMLGLGLGLAGLTAGALWAAQDRAVRWVREYVLELAPESETDRAWRHQRVAERRAGPVIMVHRGARAAAPENTLQALAVALDWGADGVEVDLRRTRDGVLVVFHDETLDRLLHGFGAVAELTAGELLALAPRVAYGRPVGGTPPSFVQVLDLVRQRAALLHLDLKEPGLEEEVARWLEAADAWDHVVAVNASHASSLVRDPRLRLLRYKVPGLYAGRRDVDPEAVRAALREPGEMLLVDDPRVAAWVLQRPRYQPVPVVRTFRFLPRPWEQAAEVAEGPWTAAQWVAALRRVVPAGSAAALLRVLREPVSELAAARAALAPEVAGAARVVERAWAADQLGQLGRGHRDVVDALEAVLRAPTPHPDWRYHSLDGAMAARALGRLRSARSTAGVIEALERMPPLPAGAGEADAESASWAAAAQGRWREHLLAALADLPGRRVRRFWWQVLEQAGAETDEAHPQAERAAQALLQARLARRELLRLLNHPRPEVRAAAVLECVDRPDPARRQALAEVAPWALELPVALTLPPPPAPARPRVRAGVEDAPMKGAF